MCAARSRRYATSYRAGARSRAPISSPTAARCWSSSATRCGIRSRGQTIINFGVSSLAAKAAPFARRAAAEARESAEELEAEDWYELACELELTAPDEAVDAYRRTLELDAGHADAHLNLGRLLHEQGDFAAAEKHYRAAIEAGGGTADYPGGSGEATARFNLGVVLEDQERVDEAEHAYLAVLEDDPAYADAHYNLAGLYERLDRRDAALRHLKSYKSLIEQGC